MKLRTLYADIKDYFEHMSTKDMGLLVSCILAVAALVFSLSLYKSKKMSGFSLRLSEASTADEYRAIIIDGCPSALMPTAEYFLAKALFDEGKHEESFRLFGKIVEKNSRHFLYGRALIGYMHSGMKVKKDPAFLESVHGMVSRSTTPWKNETLYDMAWLYESLSEDKKASELYAEIMSSNDPFWKQNAEFKLSELARKVQPAEKASSAPSSRP